MSKQYFKSLYFNDYPSDDANSRSVTLAFNEPEEPYFQKVKNMTTPELKDLIGYSSYIEIAELAQNEERTINQTIKRLIKQNVESKTKATFTEKDVTFVNSKNVPFQRWYPYIEGYSPDFVKSLIDEYRIKDCVIYEPFAGTGTTIIAADQCGLSSVYSEVNPLLQFLIQTKIKVLKESTLKRSLLAAELKDISINILDVIDKYAEDDSLRDSYQRAFGDSKYFSDETYSKILKIRSYIDFLYLEKDELIADLVSVAVFSILISVSFLKKMGDVRFRTEKEILKGEVKLIEDVLPVKINEIADDLLCESAIKSSPEFIISNSKNINRLNDLKIGAIITSPPYLNGTNYFRNTKVELWFLRYLLNDSDLRFFRDQALTSGINDVKREYANIKSNQIISNCQLLNDTLLELNKKSYDSRIQLMVQCYFNEMFEVFNNTRKHLIEDSKVLVDIGDSIFCGVHIKTDKILIELLESIGYKLIDCKILRKRRSKNNEMLSQVLMAFVYNRGEAEKKTKKSKSKWESKWNDFKLDLPHQKEPFSKKNWGNPNHSLCSYQGKLKPSIAYNLVNTFVPQNGTFFDPFSGVGTIPFEGALNGKKAYGLDISKPAYYISSAKTAINDPVKCYKVISDLRNYIENTVCDKALIEKWGAFGFNKTLRDYYEHKTFEEILLARNYFQINPPKTAEEMLVISSLLHILHGNRPYALSRRSHPIVPYAPTGDFEYKNLIHKLTNKVDKSLEAEYPKNFEPSKIFLQDSTKIWPQEITNLDAIITSPPFFDSTRFYSVNWIRIWFSGWGADEFNYQIKSFVDEKQKVDFDIYKPIFLQAKERLKHDGVFVMHLGKSVKCDMAKELQRVSKRWFKSADLFDESVVHCQNHGIKDMGTVTSHQYLVLV